MDSRIEIGERTVAVFPVQQSRATAIVIFREISLSQIDQCRAGFYQARSVVGQTLPFERLLRGGSSRPTQKDDEGCQRR